MINFNGEGEKCPEIGVIGFNNSEFDSKMPELPKFSKESLENFFNSTSLWAKKFMLRKNFIPPEDSKNN